MKKIIIIVILICTFLSQTCCAAPDIGAKSAIVIDSETGRILYQKNINEKLPMASTTKIMTAITALENSNLDENIKVSVRASHVEGSSIWLEENEEITMENALYGLMLNSGNDAATAIAEHICKNEDKFAELMNNLAKKIGVLNTNFANPHGLDNEKHYTTAYDLALITRYALGNAAFSKIVGTKEKKIPWAGHSYNRVLKNHNKLLWSYQYANGVKTGFTKKSGRCLVSSATKDGLQLICVTLKASDDWNIHKQLFNNAFENYKQKLILNENQYIRTVVVKNGKKDKIELVTDKLLNVPLLAGEEAKLRIEYNVNDYIEAPVCTDCNVGSVDVYIDSQKIASVGIRPTQFIDKVDPLRGMEKIMKNWLLMFNGSEQID